MYPAPRLIWGVAGLTVLAAATVVLPALAPMAWAYAVAIVVLVVWDARVLVARARPVVLRRLPHRAFIGRTARARVEIEVAAATYLDVLEELPRDVAEADPFFERRPASPQQPVEIEYELTPLIRGERALGPSITYESSSLGLLSRRTIHPQEQRLDVYPDVGTLLSAHALDTRRVLATLGIRPALRRGDGYEFDSLRELGPDDDPRRMDWAASARRGRPIQRIYQREENSRVVVALDTGRLMAGLSSGRSKLDFALDATLVLAYAALASGDRVSVAAFDDELRQYTGPFAHRSQLPQLISQIRRIQPRFLETDYKTLIRDLRAHVRQHCLVIVLTDFVEADPETSRALALLAERHRVLIVAIRDPIFRDLEGALSHEPDVTHRAGASRAKKRALERLVLADLLKDRETLLARLRRGGVHTLDLYPTEITAPVLNRFLELRQAG